MLKGCLLYTSCNRCGVPLIEIVSEPDIRSAQEAKAYVQKLRAIILYTGVSDCRMNEGSLRLSLIHILAVCLTAIVNLVFHAKELKE